MVDLQLGAPNAEVCVSYVQIFQLLFETFKRFEDVPKMKDFQLGAPNAWSFVTSVRNFQTFS